MSHEAHGICRDPDNICGCVNDQDHWYGREQRERARRAYEWRYIRQVITVFTTLGSWIVENLQWWWHQFLHNRGYQFPVPPVVEDNSSGYAEQYRQFRQDIDDYIAEKEKSTVIDLPKEKLLRNIQLDEQTNT